MPPTPSRRWRCLEPGCNPVLDKTSAARHRDTTTHRVAKWPVRSAEGKRRQQDRNARAAHASGTHTESYINEYASDLGDHA